MPDLAALDQDAPLMGGRHERIQRPVRRPRLVGRRQGVAGDRVAGDVTERLLRATDGWRGLARLEDPGFADDLDCVRRRAARGGAELLF